MDSLATGFRNLLTLICLLGVMFYQDWELSTHCNDRTSISWTSLSRRLGKRMKKAATGTQAETGVLAMLISENLRRHQNS